MKNRTIYNQAFKHFFSVACCLFFILASANVHGKQTRSKPNAGNQKAPAKTAERKSGLKQLKKTFLPKAFRKKTR